MICALCRCDKFLCQSHIIPEFLYGAMYDDKHRFHVVSAVPEQKDRMAQKGLREPLLCEDCETRISRFEDYAKKALIGGTALTYQREGTAVIVDGLNYKQFKLFQLSILWRAGVSKLQMFERVNLGKFAEVLRGMILNEDPGAQNTFGCVMFGLQHESRTTVDLIMQPMKVRIEGQYCYRFVFGGFMWVYFVSGREPTGTYVVGFLQESGRLSFLIKDIFEAKTIENFAKERARLGRVS
jgi:hypothetical protein